MAATSAGPMVSPCGPPDFRLHVLGGTEVRRIALVTSRWECRRNTRPPRLRACRRLRRPASGRSRRWLGISQSLPVQPEMTDAGWKPVGCVIAEKLLSIGGDALLPVRFRHRQLAWRSGLDRSLWRALRTPSGHPLACRRGAIYLRLAPLLCGLREQGDRGYGRSSGSAPAALCRTSRRHRRLALPRLRSI